MKNLSDLSRLFTNFRKWYVKQVSFKVERHRHVINWREKYLQVIMDRKEYHKNTRYKYLDDLDDSQDSELRDNDKGIIQFLIFLIDSQN